MKKNNSLMSKSLMNNMSLKIENVPLGVDVLTVALIVGLIILVNGRTVKFQKNLGLSY